jgi:hypothetical protein
LKVKGIDGTADSWSELEKMQADTADAKAESSTEPGEEEKELKLDRF